MLLIIDNYDSFVFNVARYCAELGHPAQVIRNDAVNVAEVERFAPTEIIISPGPAAPDAAGVSLEVVRRLSGRVPILGLCLGHQCIGAAFGGRIARAREPMHGRASAISHGRAGLFHGLPVPLTVGRYHSLIVAETPDFNRCLRVTARSEKGEIMALAHTDHPTFGVQFHPESILSEKGHEIFGNFFRMTAEWRSNAVA
ncbi:MULTISPECIES: anthranilate synthase component II [Actibacterium]|uniref:Para-aminobenzoate synthetase component 2 n=1 Tax=Actibacterium naphthalenivorans TaxID=1614693 RepID=A0A840CEY7_9RHOB|nr:MULTISPECIES: aminodeoxychorismate/anthranilate synthase component II [Actibacterium]ALG90848.1 anthranilate synthase [Actibacterium sp. EMB200-NS6]MBB4023850.1 para-aminobenzoate synthetase component 2 [Actibacterium naphthalenivorans]